MKETLLSYLEEQMTHLSVESIILSFIVAAVLGAVIFISYRFSHSGAVYSVKFNVTLVMLTLITTMVMTVIGNNIALSLGMVGALSIVRFRTAIKDPRETAYIFWCIAIGICCGVSQYVIACIGSAVIFLCLLILGVVKSNNRYLLIIHGSRSGETDIERTILTLYSGQATLRVKNTTTETVEYIYELSQKIVDKAEERKVSVTEQLYNVRGVSRVNMICQNEEITK